VAEWFKPSTCTWKTRVRVQEIKISWFHHNHDVLGDNSTTSPVCILRHFSLCVPTGCYGSPWLSVRHHGRTSFCCAGSQYGILLALNRKCPMVGYPGYSLIRGLDFDTSMPHAHPVLKDSRLSWNLEILISGSRTQDLCVQTLCFNDPTTGARYQIWYLAPVAQWFKPSTCTQKSRVQLPEIKFSRFHQEMNFLHYKKMK